jgi:pyrophosphate--fructose-6-phosphate 1-phosphotransferase
MSTPTPPPPPLAATAMHPRHTFSALQTQRTHAPCALPSVLLHGRMLGLQHKEALGAVADHDDIQAAFPTTFGRARVVLTRSEEGLIPATPLRIGVVLSGGQAPGGHNVIAGIFDYIKAVSLESQLIGFLDGPQGIYTGQYCIVDDHMMNCYRNAGGFDMIGSGRHKIEKPEQFEASLAHCTALALDGLVVIGGDDSNTNAALLAEYFESKQCRTKVCGAPKTIDGDLKIPNYIPTSFGFDTACQTYSELIGNLGQDTLSTQKYYHFVRLMGRAASNITLECALQTRPNVCLISEEVEAGHLTLAQITQQVVDVIAQRSQAGKDYGIVLLPEGLIEFIPEFNALIEEINDVLANGTPTTEEAVLPELSYNNRAVFSYLPENIKLQLLLDRDPHGNVQVAKIETEKLLAQTVGAELEQLRRHGKFAGKFCPQFHAYGYEGRSGLPSAFDSTYCYVLGQNVAALLALGQNGLISSVTNLDGPVSDWVCGGVPITMMCHMERRRGHMKPVIKKALVELDGRPFRCFASQRKDWARYDLYRSPGPMQFPEHDDVCATDVLPLRYVCMH